MIKPKPKPQPKSQPKLRSQGKAWPADARLLLLLTALWSIVGLLILASASWWSAQQELGDSLYYVKRQAFWLLMGWCLLLVVVRQPLHQWLRLSAVGMLAGLTLLVLTSFFGITINGASRWLVIGPVQMQPSELIKPLLILQAAVLFSNWQRQQTALRVFWIGIFALVLALVLRQPNLSTATLLGLLLWIMAFTAGLPFRHLVGVAGLGLGTGALSLMVNPYQVQRITAFLNPWSDPTGSGYQLIQSILAIGSGGMSGAGFALSTQKLHHLPFHTTDFIFAVYAEELGFIGCLFLLCFLLVFALLGLRVACTSLDRKSQLVASGATILLVGQAILNMAVATGAMPTTGLPFPLFSYGGSAVLSCLVTAGLLIRANLERAEKSYALKQDQHD